MFFLITNPKSGEQVSVEADSIEEAFEKIKESETKKIKK